MCSKLDQSLFYCIYSNKYQESYSLLFYVWNTEGLLNLSPFSKGKTSGVALVIIDSEKMGCSPLGNEVGDLVAFLRSKENFINGIHGSNSWDSIQALRLMTLQLCYLFSRNFDGA